MSITIAIIQARMGSTRLPGKVMKEVNGVPLLKFQIDRIRKARLLDKIIVATSLLIQDDVIYQFCKENGVECFRGAEKDVLDRYYQCAKLYKGNIIVRLTADCPLSDPEVIDNTIELFNSTGVDYAANTVPPETSKYPDGSDVEVFSMDALGRGHRECKDPHDREHVTFYFWRYNNGFKTCQLDNAYNWSKYRFTVDYPEDYEVVKFIIEELKNQSLFGHIKDIVNIIESNPEVKKKNSMYSFGMGWKK